MLPKQRKLSVVFEMFQKLRDVIYRSSPLDAFLGEGVLKICSKYSYSKFTSCFATLLKSYFGMGVLL